MDNPLSLINDAVDNSAETQENLILHFKNIIDIMFSIGLNFVKFRGAVNQWY